MDIHSYRLQACKTIGDYLEGKATAHEAFEWALNVIVTCDLEKLPSDLLHGVHLLFDLHDTGRPWCPTRDELESCKAELENLL